MFEEQQKLADDAIDVTDMFELGTPSLVIARRCRTQKCNSARKSCSFLELSSLLHLWVKQENVMAVQIPNALGANT